MRIITGTARGCRLETLKGEDTRPTLGKVKEGIFSALQFEIEGRQVADTFAGSGQMGLEALSRGAGGCVFIDSNPEAVAVIKRNLNAAARRDSSIQKNAQIINADSLSYLARSKDRYDIAFIDPPYSSGLLKPALSAVESHMNRGGVIVCETDGRKKCPKNRRFFPLPRIQIRQRQGVHLSLGGHSGTKPERSRRSVLKFRFSSIFPDCRRKAGKEDLR